MAAPEDDTASWSPALEQAWRRERAAFEAELGRKVALAPTLLAVVLVLLRDHIPAESRTALLAAWSVAGAMGALSYPAYTRAKSLRQVRAIELVVQAVNTVAASVGVLALPHYGVGILVLSAAIWAPNGAFIWPRRLAALHFYSVVAVSAAAHMVASVSPSLLEVVMAHTYLGVAATFCTLSQGERHTAAREAFANRHQLAEAKKELEATVQRLTRTREQLVEQGKLVALGELVAGVAHELNTPLGAIRASAENLAHAVGHTRTRIVTELRELPPDEIERLDALLQAAARQPPITTSREERAARRKLRRMLEDEGVEDAGDIAERLVEVGLVDDVTPHLSLLRSPRVDVILRHAEALTSLESHSKNIDVAAQRAAQTVLALKRYAHPGDPEAAPTRAALRESLDTVLTLFHNALKRGVEVVREYDDPGSVEAHHPELDQVWTNLVHNAIQAMQHDGRLTVRVRRDEEHCVVEVEDDGPGIPDEVASRIFEPFFTTKVSGEGAGLGLSICRDIVRRHGGTLSFTSEPGRTVFQVRLPS